MKLNKIKAVLVLVGIHAFFALLVLITGNVDTSGVKPNSAVGKIVFFGVQRHAAATPVFESILPEKKSAYFTSSFAELIKINVGDSSSIRKARALILLFDSIDATEIENDLRTLFDTLPDSVPIICVAVPPVDNRVETNRTNAQISEFNQKLKAQCAAKDNCSILDLNQYFADADGNLKLIYHTGDGVTFSERGVQIWKDSINSLIP